MRLINTNYFKFLVTAILFVSICEEIAGQAGNTIVHCLQRPKDESNHCEKFAKFFCNNIQCEPLLDCTSGNKEIVQNVTARGCCPACIEYLDEYENCEVGSELKKCRNGLFCNPSTKQCNMPGVKNKCLIEYHNRKFVSDRSSPMYFYVPSSKSPSSNPDESAYVGPYFAIKYAPDIELPVCDHDTGKYELKQCKQSKCYCVNPDDGKFTFGIAERFQAKNMTCECSHFLYKKLVGNGQNNKNVDLNNMEHYSQIHAKCDSSGNFEPLQCINSTCFCVDIKTGKPTDERAAMYGALSTLPCFDEEKSKKLKTKDADANYQSSCEKQLLKPRSIALHFLKKGTKLRGLDSVICQYDGQFAPKQCLPGSCNCVDPQGSQMKSYGVDRQGGKDLEMECKCAREEYYAETDKLAYNQLQCDGYGNFYAFQCFENQRECYCVDDDGSRISTSQSIHCIDKFKMENPIASNFKNEDICKGMRKTLTEMALDKNKFYVYDPNTFGYKAEEGEPPKDVYCNNDQCKTNEKLTCN